MLRLASPSTRPAVPATSWPRRNKAPTLRRSTLSFLISLASRNESSAIEATPGSSQILVAQSSTPALYGGNLGLRRDPELGLFSLVLVISMVFGSLFSLAIISLPILSALRKLAGSADKLSKVVSEEVPGTLASLKLSGLEINDLTCQLNNLRQRISGKHKGKKAQSKRQSYGGTIGSPETD